MCNWIFSFYCNTRTYLNQLTQLFLDQVGHRKKSIHFFILMLIQCCPCLKWTTGWWRKTCWSKQRQVFVMVFYPADYVFIMPSSHPTLEIHCQLVRSGRRFTERHWSRIETLLLVRLLTPPIHMSGRHSERQEMNVVGSFGFCLELCLSIIRKHHDLNQ